MSDPQLKWDYKGAGEVLKSPALAVEINKVAEQVANKYGDGATVKPYTIDRAAAHVIVPIQDQALKGALLAAASSVGLEVRPR